MFVEAIPTLTFQICLLVGKGGVRIVIVIVALAESKLREVMPSPNPLSLASPQAKVESLATI